MREHAGARRERHVRARARPLRRPARGARSAGARRARPGGPRDAPRPDPAARQQPARARRRSPSARPATCSPGASSCTSSSRASTTSGAAGTGSSWCAPRCRRRRATSARCAASPRRSSRSRRLVRALYRDVAENITGTRPRVLRQVAAGAEVGVYAVRHKWPVPARYRELLTGIPFVRDLLLYPPLLLDPPMNTRTGQFTEVEQNPLDGLKLEREDWLCYPALVGRDGRLRLLPPPLHGPRPEPRQPVRGRLGRGDRRRPRRRVPLRRPAGGARPLRRPADRVPRRPPRPPAGGGGPARGPLRLLRLPQEDGAHAAQRRRHGPRRHAVPRRLRAADARRRRPRHGAPHRRHRDRQERDARGAARRRRRAASARCASSPTTWARSRSAPTAGCSASAPRSAPSCASTTCSRATRSASSTAPSS